MSKRRFFFLIISIFCFLIISNVAFAMQAFWSDLPSTKSIERYDSLTGFDITKYILTLSINDATHFIEGNVKAYVTAENNLNSISYELMGGTLAVTQVLVNDSVSAFTHINGIINIPIGVISGQQFTTQVFYSGTPALSPSPYSIGMKFNTTGVYTLSNPDAGRYYWPCYDHPWDKAMIDMHITVRSDWLVAGQGIRQGITDNGNGTKTHSWSHNVPVATYVIGFAAAAFVEFNQMAGTIPIQNFVLQSDLADAQIDFANVPAMIALFSEVYGPYPFEKYGHAVMSISTYGAMEHQTMTLMGAGSISGNQSSEAIISHELGHQWMGDAVTPLSMVDVWLKEGFAVYSEFLWKHKKLGWTSGLQYLWTSIQNYYLNWENSNPTRVMYNPPYNSIFTPCTYEKGASVIHMMRLKMGNPTFSNFVHTWFNTYTGSNVVTAEFQAMAEQVSGLDFNQFFHQWVYSPGIPSAKLTYFTDRVSNAKIVAQTTSSSSTPFDIEIPLKLANSTLLDSIVVRATPQGFATIFPMNIATDNLANIQIDPNHWVLKRAFTVNTFQLTLCSPANHRVYLGWTNLDCPTPLSGYNIYRKNTVTGVTTKINMFPIAQRTYTDVTAMNGVTYQYQIAAADEQGFESLPTNAMTATPIDFPFDWGFLVVDETRDGTGSTLSPTDLMVDEYYANVLNGLPYTPWDISAMGAPTLSSLSHYPIVLWHCDDFADFLLDDYIQVLTSYVQSGGKLIISGWKYTTVLPQSFIDQWLSGVEPVVMNQPILISAHSDFYQNLHPDPEKLNPAWNGLFNMATIFPGGTQPLYTAETPDSLSEYGEPLAIRIDNNGVLILLGFPLYYMLETEVHEFMMQIVPQLYPEIIVANYDNACMEPAKINCYPNPFVNSINISLGSQAKHTTGISLFNLKGQKVIEWDVAHIKELNWDGKDFNGQDVGTGMYFLKIETKSHSVYQKILKIK